LFKIEKKFTIPVGHRLSKHSGLCSNIHGHNFTILVGIKSEYLNDNDMLLDFSDLKKIVNEILDKWDHALMLNTMDDCMDLMKKNMKIIKFNYDPTAEILCQILYREISHKLKQISILIEMDYVTIYENENSKATFSLD